MWAVRRASSPLRNQSCCILFNHTFYAKPGAPSNLENGIQYSKGYLVNRACYMTKPISHGEFWPALSLAWGRSFSSQVGTTSSDNDDDLEDGFSDFEMSPEIDKIEEPATKDNDEFSVEEDSDGEDGGVNDDTLGLPDNETDGEKEPSKKTSTFKLLKVIMDAPRSSLNNALDKWVGSNILGEGEISSVLRDLRKRRLYAKALQFMNWVDESKRLDYKERDYASRLDLFAKLFGIQKAESYMTKVPKSFRGEVLYRTLLANYVMAGNVKKVEEVFNKIRDLGFPISSFSYNQLILLYKRTDRKKIGDVLKMMEKENVKPTLFTYNLLIDTKGYMHDISGMEDVIATMEAQGIKPDVPTQAAIARHYIFSGKKEKAEAMLRAIEGSNITENRAACAPLLPLYAALKKTDDVGRIWKMCEGNPKLDECISAIEAWGMLGKIEDAERVFEKMSRSSKRLLPKYYNILLKVYADHKLLSKGKELVNRMVEDGCNIGPLTWDALVKLYVEADEVEKADSILQKAVEQRSRIKPLYNTFIYVLEKYSDRGDIHNAEKVFHELRRIGYVGRMRQYQLLLQAYINAKTPAYGFRERMKADNIFPNKAAMELLQAANAFRRTWVSSIFA